MASPIRNHDLTFPALDEYIERGSCGQKGCSATLTVAGVSLPIHLQMAGSGKPDGDAAESVGAGTLLQWKYNNMITHHRAFGWIMARVDPDRTSVAELGKRVVDGREILTVVRAELCFRFLFPRFRMSFAARDPVRLALQDIQSLSLYAFGQEESTRLLGRGRRGLSGLDTERLFVSSSGGLTIEDATRPSEDRVVFRVRRTVGQEAGPFAWFVHSPEETGKLIPVGFAEFRRDSTDVIDVPLASYPHLLDGRKLTIEALSLRQHGVWTQHKLP